MLNAYVGYVVVSTKIHCRSLNQPQVHSIAVFWSISRAGEASRTTLAARRNHDLLILTNTKTLFCLWTDVVSAVTLKLCEIQWLMSNLSMNVNIGLVQQH